ncbi:hypothetical protein [Peterkaempfera bronchialis]|uniref:hypothetical protein n=1 Tax=Peterkaempfera bronchialis TaxID=2126346 RepID=UPI003C2B27C9
MTVNQHEVGRLLRIMAADAQQAALGRPGPAEPVDIADQLQDVIAMQQRATANTARCSQASPEQPAARTGALVFAWASARLGLVGAVLGETLEAATHLSDPGSAGLNARQLAVLEGVVAQGLESTRRGLSALSADLLTVGTSVTAGPPWPTVPLPAAAIASADPPAPAPMPPAAGEHEPRPSAARQRTRHLLIVAAPPAASTATAPPSATVLPFRRP